MTTSPELQNIVTFLHQQHPFTILPLDVVQSAARTIEISYIPKKQRIFSSGDDNSYLYIVRTGAIDITDEQGNLAERCGEGDFFGFPSVLTEIPTRFNADSIEDSLVYMLPTTSFHQLRRDYPEFDQHFVMVHSERVLDSRVEQSDNLPLTMQIRHMLKRQQVTITPDASVQIAAQHMRRERVSSLLVVDNDQLVGILTDRDIRNRVVAEGLSFDTLIAKIMTPDPLTIAADEQSLQAQLLMSRYNIHHLPVMDAGQLIGLITTTDLMRLQSSNSVHLIGEIGKQDSPESIAKILSRLPQLVLSLVDADATAYDIGHIVTQITDAVTSRLIKLAEEKVGQAPMPYVWLAFGSQARQEQSATTDQDNGLLLAQNPSEDEAAYFSSLANFVCDGLALCGYEYCPGGIMATNWCYSIETWREKFFYWINKPDPEALLNATVFFDMRPIFGDFTLSETLIKDVWAKAKDNGVFLGSLANNALGFQPPLGFFRRFVLEKGGEHHQTLDLKQRGVTPIIDMTRVYSLAYGITLSNTTDRLKALILTPAIASEDGANLTDALEFIAYVRLQHQGQQIAAGETVDNFVDPNSLSSFERQHLKTAFTIVRRIQNTLSQRYLTSYMG